MISEEQITAILEAFAVGDAMGMPTEFMTRTEIVSSIGQVIGLLDSSLSVHHADLPAGSVTDDTEQTLYLLDRYLEKGVSIASTVEGLLSWIEESDAIAKRYIGPSSLKALQAIKNGIDPKEAGKNGTTCGGLMRSLAPVLYAASHDLNLAEMLELVVVCLIPTHYTSQALEAACAYAAAVYAALREDSSVEKILDAAIEGGMYGVSKAPFLACSASSVARLQFATEFLKTKPSEKAVLDFLFSVIGTGLPSADVFTAVMTLFLYAPGNTFESICLAASVGGDTDTIAALVGGLNRAYNPHSEIPQSILERVYEVNNLAIQHIASRLIDTRKE
ncbi:MAG: ADP-ribosylglycohydrolase family protein [Sphaerochaetaceae bacterium]